MAVSFTDKRTGFINTWTELHNIVSSKSLYNDDDYNGLSVDQKEEYLFMLYQNNDALAQRLPEDYYSDYIDTQSRYALLRAENQKYEFTLNIAKPEYREQLTQQFNAQFNAQLASDIKNDDTWISWLVNKNYNGNYAEFLSDYSGETASKDYYSVLPEMVPEKYDLSEESFERDIDTLQSKYAEAKRVYDNQVYDAYTNTLQAVRAKIADTAKKDAFDNASNLEKTLNTLWQIPTLMALELGNVVEGLVDTTLGVTALAVNIFGGDSTEIENIIKTELWSADTYILNTVTNSYLSQYADDNIAKIMYNVGISIVDMAPMLIPGVGTYLYYGSAFGRNLESELNAGYEFGEAFAYSATATAIEWATEKLSGDVVFGKGLIKKWDNLGSKNMATKIMHDFIGEGIEEVISGVGTGIAHGVITGDYQLDKKDLWESFLVGGIVGGIMASGNTLYTKHLITKTGIQLQNANGESIVLSAKQGILLDNYVKQTAKKIADGKQLSQREQRRFDRVKDFKITDTTYTNKSLKAYAAAINSGMSELNALQLLEAESFETKIEAGLFDENNKPVKTGDIKEENARLKKLAQKALTSAPDDSDFISETEDLNTEEKQELAGYIYDLSKPEEIERAQRDFSITLINTLGKIRALFGDDVVTKGIEGAAKYIDKTIDEIGEMFEIGTEDSDFSRLGKSSNMSLALKEHFKNAEFILVQAEQGQVLDNYDKLQSAIDNLNRNLKLQKHNAFASMPIRLFFTTSESVSTSFIANGAMYVNAHWLQTHDIGHIKDVVISKFLAENARARLMKSSFATSEMLWNAVSKIELPDRSPYIVLQELCYSMIYTKNNTLMQQLMSFNPKNSRFLIEYFDKLRSTYADVSVQNACGQAFVSMLQACEDNFGTEETGIVKLPEDKVTTIEQLIDSYREHTFRALPFITGTNGMPAEVAKLNAMYIHMQKVYGFNKKLDISKKINWLKELSNPKNYDNDGFNKLSEELQKYQTVSSRTGHTFSTVVTKKGFNELLNYYLDITCGIMITPKGYITSSELMTKVIDYAKITSKLKSMKLSVSADRKRIGTMSDFITDYTKQKLSPVFLDADIYVTFDSNSDTQGMIIGSPNSKMGLVINISDIETKLNKTTIVGGQHFILSSTGELAKNPDGTYQIEDDRWSVPKPASVIGHEIGHAIGMMLKFNGSFCEDDIAKIWAKFIIKMAPEKPSSFVNSIKDFFLKNNKVVEGRDAIVRIIKPDENFDNLTPEQRNKIVIDYIDRITKINGTMSRNDIAKLLLPIATYLYHTGYANEMYANGKASAVARPDLIHSFDISDTKGSDFPKSGHTVLYLDSKYKKNAPEFISILDGTDCDITTEYGVDELIDQCLDTVENVTRRVYATVDSNIKSLKEVFDIESDSMLINPDFWAQRIDLSKPENSKFRLSKYTLIEGLERKYDCHYDSIAQEFKPGYIQKYIPDVYDTIARKEEDYSVLFLNDGTVINTRETSAYNDGSDISAAVIYNPAKSKKPAMVTVRLNTGDLQPSVIARLNEVFAWAPERRLVIADGRTFKTAGAALKYLSIKETKSNNPDFETLFNQMMETAITTGRQTEYLGDTIYMTSDGKIYNMNSNMFIWYSASEVPGLVGEYTQDDSGNYQTDNEEGISYTLSKLFDGKQVIRLYREGDSWKAYGIPNKLQDTLIRELKAERKSKTPYFEVKSNQRLFINTKGDLHTEIHSDGWKNPDFIEVEWRGDIWYESIRQIMSKYSISKVKDFERLGFSKAFIKQLTAVTGIEYTDKDGNVRTKPGGLTKEFINAYIRDDANSVLSRDILIENAPARTDGASWRDNAHIRSIRDAKEYFANLKARGMLLQDDTIYDSWLDFQLATEKALHDPALIGPNTANGIALEKTARVLGLGECYIQLFNMDARVGLRGLDISQDSFRMATKGLTSYASRERVQPHDTELTKTDESGKELEYIADTVDLDTLLLKKDKLSKVLTGFVDEILEIRKISDVEERNAALSELYESTYLPRYTSVHSTDDMSAIRNIITNELEGSKLQQGRAKEIDKAIKRIEAYEQLEEGSPEQLRERKKLIEYYEQLGNARTALIAKGGEEYYKNLLHAVSKVGAYSKNMNEKFSNAMAKAKQIRQRITDTEHFDSLISNLTTMRDEILKIDKEYPGWYDIYESYISMLQAWLSGKSMVGDKTIAAVQQEIIDYIDSWENATEFRESIAARERVDTYINAVRGAVYTPADLERFRNIPEELPEIDTFPKQAQQLYIRFKDETLPVSVLENILADAKTVTDLVKRYGQNFVYHLQRLYNDFITPPVGSISKAKQADWLTSVLEKAGATKEQTGKVVIKNLSYSKAVENTAKIKQARYIDYRKHSADYALRVYDFLKGGEEVTEKERTDALKQVGKEILNYRWKKKNGDIIDLFHLSRDQKYRVVTAVVHAYYEFLENPPTDRSITKFENDVDVALTEMKINRTLPGDTKRSLISIGKPKKDLKIDMDYIVEKLKPIVKGEIKSFDSISQEVETFRNTVFAEESLLDEIVESSETKLDKLEKTLKKHRRIQRARAGATVVSSSTYNIRFNEKTGQFEDFNGIPVDSDLVNLHRLSETEFTKYIDYQIDAGIAAGELMTSKKGHIKETDSPRIRFMSYSLPEGSKYYNSLTMVNAMDALGLEFDSEEPSDEDFEDGASVSKSIEFIELEALDDLGYVEPTKEPKGTWAEDDTPTEQKTLTAKNTNKLLSYKPRNYGSGENFVMNSATFIEDNAIYLNAFVNSETDMNEFVSWIESTPSIPLNSPQEAIIFALLNKVTTSVVASRNLKSRAESLINALGSRAGRTLGMFKKLGVTPVDQLASMVQKFFSDLSDSEIETLRLAAENQANAIAARDYAAAERQLQYVLDIIKAHADQLPTSMNIFAKGLSDEERTTRMHNIIEKITSWRYFAMLGAPTTFFTKNLASNVIITGMNYAAEKIASILPKGQQLTADYAFTEKVFDGIIGVTDDEARRIKQEEYDRLILEVTQGRRAATLKEIEEIEDRSARNAERRINETYKNQVLLSIDDVKQIVDKVITNIDDRRKIDIAKLTAVLNDFIKTRYTVQKHMPNQRQIANYANEWMRKQFYQYRMDKQASTNAKSTVKKQLIDNGLLDGIMNDTVSKYDRGYDVKIGKLKDIALNPETSLDEISEADASILADAINKNSPFKWELLNKYYRFIFKTMEWGDKKFIRPKIVKVVENLVESNMTEAEIEALDNGDKAARAKFEEFIAFAVDDTMKTYFRSNSDLQVKIMRLFNGHPVAQLIFGTLIPFPRMLMNTMSTALSYSPIGFIKAWTIARQDNTSFARLKVNKELGKAITGSALITLGAILAAAGILDFDDDDEYGGAQIILGNKIRIALTDFTPSAIPLVIGATITHSATEGFWNATTAGANALLDATILGEALEIFGANKTGTDFIADSFTSFVNQFIPSVFRHVTRTIDPAQKKYSSNKGIKIMQRVAASIPGLSLIVPSKVDPYTGNAIYQNASASEGWARILSFFNMFSPAKITADIESDVEIESKAVDAPTTGPAKTYTIDGIKYTIPDNVYHEYQILRAKLYSSYAKEVINTQAYQKMTLTQKKAKLSQLQTKATQEARKQLNIGK